MLKYVIGLECFVPGFTAPVAIGVAFHEGRSVGSVLGCYFSVACHVCVLVGGVLVMLLAPLATPAVAYLCVTTVLWFVPAPTSS